MAIIALVICAMVEEKEGQDELDLALAPKSRLTIPQTLANEIRSEAIKRGITTALLLDEIMLKYVKEAKKQ